MFNTWLIEIKIRGARPHNRRALHAACLIPRACGSLEFYEESQATSEPACLGLVVTIVLANRRLSFTSLRRPLQRSRDGGSSSSLTFYSRHERLIHSGNAWSSRHAQTMPVLTSKHSPSKVDVRVDCVESARRQHKYRVLLISARRILLLSRNHSQRV